MTDLSVPGVALNAWPSHVTPPPVKVGKVVGFVRVPPSLEPSRPPQEREEARQRPRPVRIAVEGSLDQFWAQPVRIQLDVVLEARRQQKRHAVRDSGFVEPRLEVTRHAPQELGQILQLR
ncbi:hypothetical protein [Streptomyces ardesiacus]|uniref:hypothetical protein n=1 Tax=Streptomyces ardesiacus TaxID=285564 RepID=UPI00367E54AA